MSANASLVITVVDQFDVTMPGVLVEHPLSSTLLYTDANGQVTFGTMFDGTQEFQVAQNIEVYEHTVHRINLTAGNNTTKLGRYSRQTERHPLHIRDHGDQTQHSQEAVSHRSYLRMLDSKSTGGYSRIPRRS